MFRQGLIRENKSLKLISERMTELQGTIYTIANSTKDKDTKFKLYKVVN